MSITVSGQTVCLRGLLIRREFQICDLQRWRVHISEGAHVNVALAQGRPFNIRLCDLGSEGLEQLRRVAGDRMLPPIVGQIEMPPWIYSGEGRVARPHHESPREPLSIRRGPAYVLTWRAIGCAIGLAGSWAIWNGYLVGIVATLFGFLLGLGALDESSSETVVDDAGCFRTSLFPWMRLDVDWLHLRTWELRVRGDRIQVCFLMEEPFRDQSVDLATMPVRRVPEFLDAVYSRVAEQMLPPVAPIPDVPAWVWGAGA